MPVRSGTPPRRIGALFLVFAIVLACGSAEERSEDARQRFDEALSRDDREAALLAWEELADSLPESPETRLELARRLNRAGESGRARWVLEEGAEQYPDHTILRLELAKTALVVGDPAHAIETLSGLSETGREHPGAILLLSEAQVALGDLDAGLSTLAEAEERHPERPEFRIARIEALSKEKRFAEALELTRDAVSRTDLDRDQLRWLNLQLAAHLAMTNDLEGALRALEAMIEGDPRDAEAWQRRAGILVGQGHAEEACEQLSATLDAHPDAAELYPILATAQLARGDQAAAEAALRALAERAPGPASAEALASFLHHTGRSSQGAAVLGEAVERAGDDTPVELAYLHVAMLLSAGQPEDAERAFLVFRDRYDGDPRVEYLLGRFDLAEGRNANAAARLKRLAPELDRSDLQHWIGVALERMGDDAGAEYRYAMAINRNPAQIPSYLGILRVLERQESWLQMEGLARALIRHAPGNLYGFEALTRAVRGRGEQDAVVAVLRTYAQHFPELPGPVVSLSVSLRARGESAEALAVLDEAAPRFGADPLWIAERASVLEHLGRSDEGLREVVRALTEHPQNAALHRARAYLMFRSGRGEEGLEEVETLLRLDPDDATPLRMSGDYLSMRGDFAGARRAYDRYLALQPNDSRVLFHLGIALQQLGEVEAALAAYRQSVAINVEFLPARNNLAMLLAETGWIDAGLLAAQANYARAPEEPVVMDTLAWLYLKKGLAERAVALLERASHAAPKSEEIREHLAEARAAASRPQQARAPTNAPTAPPKVDVRARLAELGRPHIILVLVDTLRADWTSPYGFDVEVTPELQRWADGGVVFERTLAQSSWTKVSMASLLTSLWPRSHGIRLATDGLGKGALTLSEVLRASGYRTFAVQSNGWLEQSFGFHQGFDRYVFPRTEGRVGHARTPALWPHGERVLEEGSRMLEAQTGDSPIFLYLHFMDVHEYAAPPEFKRFGEDDRGHYLAAIRWVDSLLERMRAELTRLGLAERSVLIFASDHGEAFGENQSFGHARNVFSPVLHVPLVIRFPFRLEPHRIRAQVRNLDIAPTILDIAGVPVPKSYEGSSLLPLIVSAERQDDRAAYSALGAPIIKGAVEQVAVNDGGWTVARNLDEEGREFLFDRSVDPWEDANVLDFEPDERKRMISLLDAHVSVARRPDARDENVRIDPLIAERLRSLGYLQ